MNDHCLRQLQHCLDELVATGRERGIQVAAYHDGALIAHAWAGVADPASGTPVDGDTLFPAYSVSKGIAATVTHVLIARGAFALDTPLATLWPAFGAHGKDRVTVAHVLEHSAGVPYFPAGLAPEDLRDPERIAALIAAAEPAWEPGTRTGYHSLTFGYLLDETIRRATGRSLHEAVRTELCVPLGIENDLFIVPPADQDTRLADVDADAFSRFQDSLPGGLSFQRAVGGLRPGLITPRRHIPAAPLPFGVTMTARAGARLYAALAAGGEGLLPAGDVERATTIRWRDRDEITGVPALKSLGYTHADPVGGHRESAFGMGGLGGSEAYADPGLRFSFALTHNRLTPPTEEDAAPTVARVVREALGLS